MSTRIAILADVDADGGLPAAPAHVLAPIRRIFEPVLNARSVCMTRFSDFPRIILCGTSDDVSEDRWRDMVYDLQVQLLGDQIVLRFDLPVVMFCHRYIEGSSGLLPPGYLLELGEKWEPGWRS